MHATRSLLSLGVALVLGGFAAATAHAQLDLPRVSPKASVTQTIGITEMNVSYHRPGVKDRVIWGGLVPYDEIWRTGANDATTFKTAHDVTIEGQKLPAGTYALFTIPSKETWTVVFNSQADQWGAFEHDKSKDVVTLKLKPQTAPHREWMMFSFENLSPTSGELVLSWEKMRLPMKIEISTDPILASVRKAMAEAKADDWRTPYRSADFCYNYGVAMDEAMAWAERSTKVEQNYFNMTLLAKMHAKAGDTKKALAAAEKALAINAKAERPIDARATEAMVADWKGQTASKAKKK